MLNFAEIYIEKCEFHTSVKLIDINDVDIEHILLILNKCSIRRKYSKYFIGYTSGIMSVYIKLPKVCTC